MKRKTNTIIPNVVRGGVAIPLGDNYFYMKGRKHKDGGIDIGRNPRTGLEVESDEIVHTSPKELKVYSSVPFLNGISPAEKLLGGENPNKVFDEQQRFKKVNNINDDGTKNGNTNKAENGTIKSNKYVRKFILPKKYSRIPFVQKYVDSFVKKFEHLSNEEIANRLYNNLYQGYNPDFPLDLKRRIEKAVLNNEKERDDVVNHNIRRNGIDALFAEYLNIPKDKRRKLNYISILSDSEYKPTNSKDNITYRKINLLDDDTKYSIINRAINDSKEYKKYVPHGDHNNKALKIGENTTSKILSEYGLGTHTIGRNIDPNKGEYVSYYDLWDMAPIGKSGGKDQSLGIGKPINIYDRIYLDDYYGVDSTPEKGNYYGGYISESHVTANNKKSMGGLSRNKDYGSKKKPYPDVNKSDFAGGNRSYPIPTKADAVDALRLAGLHGRKDVRAKVLSKYPELRQKAKRGGIYTVNIGGVEHLKSTSFTGKDSKRNIAEFGIEKRDNTRVNNYNIDRVNRMNEEDGSDITSKMPSFNFYDTYKRAIGKPSIQTIDSPRDNTDVKIVNYNGQSGNNDTNTNKRKVSGIFDGEYDLTKPIDPKGFLFRKKESDIPSKENTIGSKVQEDFIGIKEESDTPFGPDIMGPNPPKGFVRRNSNITNNVNVSNTGNKKVDTAVKPIHNIKSSTSPNAGSKSTPITTKTPITNKPKSINNSSNVVKPSTNDTKVSDDNNSSSITIDRQEDKDYYNMSKSVSGFDNMAKIQYPNNTLAPRTKITDNTSKSGIKKFIEENNVTLGDAIGTLSNIAGNLISYGVNKRMLKNLKTPNQPIARQAAKLKTKVNINPQLDTIRENVSSNERDIEGNTASSRTALARKQRIRNIGQQQTNQLYGSKENTETQLINQDKLNQQEVTNKNIEDYNKYQDTVTAFKNVVDEKKSENAVNLISGINNSMQDLISRREKRNADKQTRLAMVAAHPNVNPRILRDLGIKGITDKDITRWDKAFGRKKNTK